MYAKEKHMFVSTFFLYLQSLSKWFANKIIKHIMLLFFKIFYTDILHNFYKVDKRVIVCQTVKIFFLFVKIFNQFGNKILGGLQQVSLV